VQRGFSSNDVSGSFTSFEVFEEAGSIATSLACSSMVWMSVTFDLTTESLFLNNGWLLDLILLGEKMAFSFASEPSRELDAKGPPGSARMRYQ
jgi:hypothetical protein